MTFFFPLCHVVWMDETHQEWGMVTKSVSLCFLIRGPTVLSCAALFPSVKYCVCLPTFTPLLLTHQAQGYCLRLLDVLPAISLFPSHAYWNDPSNTARLICVTVMTSGPSTSMTLCCPQRKNIKKSTHMLSIIWCLPTSAALLTHDSPSRVSLLGCSHTSQSQLH